MKGIEKERKVKNHEEKEKVRGGNRRHAHGIVNGFVDTSDIENRVFCGDSEEVLKKFQDNCVDLIITSPPYNFGLDYNAKDEFSDSLHWNNYFDKLNKIWVECFRVLKPSGRICVNVQPLFSDYVPTHHIISNQLMKLGLLWKAEVLWDKHNYNAKFTAWGSWKSPSMPYLKYTWEFIEIFSKETHKKVGEREGIDITGDEFKKWVNAKWDVAPERNMKEYEHPAMFPEEIPYRLIKLFSYKNDLVLDPFNGAGTTTKVAKELCRRYIGIDLSEDYCKKAEKRMSQSQLRVFL